MKNELERRELNDRMEIKMAVLENEVKNIKQKIDDSDRQNAKDHALICADVGSIKSIITEAMDKKADKSEVTKLETQVRQIDETADELKSSNAILAWKVGSIAAILTAIVSYVMNYLIKSIN